MNESNSIEAIDRMNLTEQTKFQLDEISRIENYFYQEIDKENHTVKKLNKYVTAFDYIDKILILLSATTGGVSICPFMSVVGAPVEMASASFTLIVSLTAEIVKKLLCITRNKKKKHNKMFILT